MSAGATGAQDQHHQRGGAADGGHQLLWQARCLVSILIETFRGPLCRASLIISLQILIWPYVYKHFAK